MGLSLSKKKKKKRRTEQNHSSENAVNSRISLIALICRLLSTRLGMKNKSRVLSVAEAQISTIVMGCAVPVLLYFSFWQLGSSNTLHIHVKLCLTMKLQSPDILLQTQLMLLRRRPSVQECRCVYCQRGVYVSLQCRKTFRRQKSLGLIVLRRWLGDENETAHHTSAHRRDKNCFNEVEIFSVFVFRTKPWIIDTTEKSSRFMHELLLPR